MNKDQLKLIITVTLISAITSLGFFVGLLLLAEQADAMDRNQALVELFNGKISSLPYDFIYGG